MRKTTTILALIFFGSVLSSPAMANPQHERMRNCNKTAKEQTLKGDERRAFMKTCLSGKHTPQPESAGTTAPVEKTDQPS